MAKILIHTRRMLLNIPTQFAKEEDGLVDLNHIEQLLVITDFGACAPIAEFKIDAPLLSLFK